MRDIKMCLFFLGALFGMALMGFSGLGIFGICGFFISLIEQRPGILIGLGLFVICVLFVTIGWYIFCKFADKLNDI